MSGLHVVLALKLRPAQFLLVSPAFGIFTILALGPQWPAPGSAQWPREFEPKKNPRVLLSPVRQLGWLAFTKRTKAERRKRPNKGNCQSRQARCSLLHLNHIYQITGFPQKKT
jgi:hypothetical protein